MAQPRRSAVRQRVYAEIVACAREGLAAYYQRHPERLGDERAKDALTDSMAGVASILKVLDRYDVAEREPPHRETKARQEAYTQLLATLTDILQSYLTEGKQPLTGEQKDWATSVTAELGRRLLAVLDDYTIERPRKRQKGNG